MAEHYLHGSEQVQRAGRNMAHAAEQMERAMCQFGHYVETMQRTIERFAEAAAALERFAEAMQNTQPRPPIGEAYAHAMARVNAFAAEFDRRAGLLTPDSEGSTLGPTKEP